MSTAVAAKAASIDAAQARPLTWKSVVRSALLIAVAGLAIYLVLPKLIAVLGAWPRLSTLNPAWFAVGSPPSCSRSPATSPCSGWRYHDYNQQELELKTNTQLTREIDRLTIELHKRVMGDSPS
jgi:hypothetical protein